MVVLGCEDKLHFRQAFMGGKRPEIRGKDGEDFLGVKDEELEGFDL